MGKCKATLFLILFLWAGFPGTAQVLVDWNARWSWFKGTREPSSPNSLWRESGFDASGWSQGNAPFSYGEGTNGTLLPDMLGKYTTFYIRKEFVIDDLNDIDELAISVDYDDGFVLWLNGTLTLKANAPLVYDYLQGAPNSHESGEYEHYLFAGETLALVSGTNVIAIQGFNLSRNSSDFFLDARVEGIKRLPETGGVSCDVPGGFYSNPFSVNITSSYPGETVKYTLDGSDPRTSRNAIPALSPVTVWIDPASTAGGRGQTPGVILRASKFETGFDPSKPLTRSYLFVSRVKNSTSHPGGGWPVSSINGQVIDLLMDTKVTTDSRYSPLLDKALLDIPTISLVTDPAHLFNQQSGIYVNATYHGRNWERPSHAELINPDGSPGFAIDAGLRIRGGWSRHDEFAKHAFRLFFRSEYGEGKLRFPLFGEEGVDEFDKVDLRTSQNYSWSKGGEEAPHSTMNRDVFSRDSQRDMHQLYTRSRYYHLYLNGVYWGIYQTQERADADFAQSYLGGDNEDYDVIKVDIGDNYNLYNIEATEGNTDAWEEIWNLCRQGFTTNENYFRLMGLNQAGEKDPSLRELVDVDNLIDYMLVIFYAGNFDAPVSKFSNNGNPNNFYALYDRSGKHGGFRFLAHDAEHTLLTDPVGPGIGLNENRVNIGTASPQMNVTSFLKFQPQWLHHCLTKNEEYRVRFADRVYHHFFNGGVFTPDSCIRRFRKTADQLDMAIIAESARWGDQGSWPARTRDKDWIPAVNRVVNDYMPFRTAIVLQQLKNENLVLSLEPPVFSMNGAVITGAGPVIDSPVRLLMQNPNASGSILYTLDGTDPRMAGGNPSATALSGGTTLEISIQPGTRIKARTRYMTSWSALQEILFQDQALFTYLKITEIHYHPADREEVEDKDLEFLELKNTGTTPLDLSGLEFTEGIRFTFPAGTLLPPMGFIVIASSTTEYTRFYGYGPSFEFSGNLSNGGERIVLKTNAGLVVFSFAYSDQWPWPGEADGDGYSLAAAERNPTGDPGLAAYWSASGQINGSPLADDYPVSATLPASGYETVRLDLYPNPARESLNLVFHLPAGQTVETFLTDLTGRRLYPLMNQYLPAGKYSTTLSLTPLNLHPGVYVVSFRTPDSFVARKFIHIK